MKLGLMNLGIEISKKVKKADLWKNGIIELHVLLQSGVCNYHHPPVATSDVRPTKTNVFFKMLSQ